MKTQCYMIIEFCKKKENKTIRTHQTHIHILTNVLQYKHKSVETQREERYRKTSKPL